jgi:sec-independent protein translocase protein TatA
MLGGIGPSELIIILIIVLVLFGPGKLPDLANGLGKGLRDFKKAMQEPDEPDRGQPPEETPQEAPPGHEKRKAS